MRTLLLYPRFPKNFWSWDKALELFDKKVFIPPLGLITAAAILPQEWEFKLVDRNIREVTEAEWNWADLVILSGMIAQKEDFLTQIQEAKHWGKSVAVGGPYPTSLPDDLEAAGADYLVLDEGEITLPMLVEALDRGETKGTFRSPEKPDVTQTPMARYDLLELNAYDTMPVQFSRGCPFQCEFCDIIVLYGRKPRTKTHAQVIQELEYLYDLGWRGNVFLVDDNFIGNKRNVKLWLKELKVWSAENDYPFSFVTQASVDLAQDPELMELMVESNFWGVFLGIESPEEETLKLTKKNQNTRSPLLDSVNTIMTSGLVVLAGFILGFDEEKSGAGDRIVQFVEAASISTAMWGLLQAAPNTALWHRLEKEGRLFDKSGTVEIGSLMNFVPSRPIEEIAREYLEGVWQLYEPKRYLDRAFRAIQKTNQGKFKHKNRSNVSWQKTLQVAAFLSWKYGVVLETRWQFWGHLWQLARSNPDSMAGYIMGCAQLEHFLEHRQYLRDRISEQLTAYQKARQEMPELSQIAS